MFPIMNLENFRHQMRDGMGSEIAEK